MIDFYSEDGGTIHHENAGTYQHKYTTMSWDLYM